MIRFSGARETRVGVPAAVGGCRAGVSGVRAEARSVGWLGHEQQGPVARTEQVGVPGELDDGLAFESRQGRVPLVNADFEGAGTGHAGGPALSPHFEQRLLRDDVVGAGFEEERQPVAGRSEPEGRTGLQANPHVFPDGDPRRARRFDPLAGFGGWIVHTIDSDRAGGVRDPCGVGRRDALVVEVVGCGDDGSRDARADGDSDPAFGSNVAEAAPGHVLCAELGEDAGAEGLAALGREGVRSSAVKGALDVAVLEGVVWLTA